MISGKKKERNQAIGRGVKNALSKTNSPPATTLGYGELCEIVQVLKDSHVEMKAKIKKQEKQIKKLEKQTVTQKGQINELRCSLATTILRSGNDMYNVTEFTGHKSAVTCLCWWQSMLFTGSSDRSVKCWSDNAEGDFFVVATLRGHAGTISSLVDLGMFIGSSSADGKVKVWDPKDPNFACVATLEKHVGSCNKIIYHPKVKHLASGGSDGYIYVYAPNKAFDLDHKVNTEAGGVFSMCLFGVNYVASGHSCGTVKVWDATSSWLCNRTITAAHPNAVTACVDYRGLLVSMDKAIIKVWDPSQDWDLVGEGYGHRKATTGLAVSPQTGDYPFNTIGMIVSSSAEGFLYFWDIRTLMFHKNSAHSQKIKMKYYFRMSVENNYTTRRYGELNFEDQQNDLTSITSILFTRNGQGLLTGDRKARIKIWGGFSAMYTSIPLDEIREKLEEIRILEGESAATVFSKRKK